MLFLVFVNHGIFANQILLQIGATIYKKKGISHMDCGH